MLQQILRKYMEIWLQTEKKLCFEHDSGKMATAILYTLSKFHTKILTVTS